MQAGVEMAPGVVGVPVVLKYCLALNHILVDERRKRFHVWAGTGKRQLNNGENRIYYIVGQNGTFDLFFFTVSVECSEDEY